MKATCSIVTLLAIISSVFPSPYGPAPSSSRVQHTSQTVSSYSGNDELRFHPESSQYFSNSAPTAYNQPSQADIANLQQQEAQQQTIINAQKRLETDKIVKDIEFIQQQQQQLQKQIREQEMKNQQKLSNSGTGGHNGGGSGSYNEGGSGSYNAGGSGSYNGVDGSSGSYSGGPNSPEKKFNDGLYRPSNQFDDGLYKGNKNFDDGLYKGEGGYGSHSGGSVSSGQAYPDFQPPSSDQRIPCAEQSHICVAKHLCVNGKVNTDGIGIIQLRLSTKTCRADVEVCCKEEDDYQSKPHSGGSSYNSGSSFNYQQEEVSFQHQASGSSAYSSGSSAGYSNLPTAKLPDFVPPAATAPSGGYGK